MEIGRKSVVIIASQAIGALLGAVALAFIGRNVAPSVMGQVAYALGLAALVGSLANLGLNQSHIRKVHDHALDACHGAFFGLRARAGLVTLLASGAAFGAWNHFKGFEDTTIGLLILALLYQAILLFRGTLASSFNAWQQTARAQSIQLADTFLRVPIVIVICVLIAGNQISGPEWIMAAYIIGALGAMLVATAWFRRAGYRIGPSSKDLRKQYLAFGLPLALSGIIAKWTLQLDTVMIGFFGNAADVGTYFAANRIIQIILAFPVAFGILLMPNFARLYKQGKDAVAESGRVIRQLALAIIPPLGVLALYPETVLRIAVGGKYAGGADALQWLALFAILATLRVVPITIAKARDQPRIAFIAATINLAANIVLNVALIPKTVLGMQMAGLGVQGAAIATLASQAIALAFVIWTQRGHVGRLRPQIIMVPAALFVIFLQFPAPIRIWELAAVGGLFCAINWAALYLTGGLPKEDVKLAADAIHPIRFLRYIREEMKFRPPS